MSSSLVGTTSTRTFESGAEMSRISLERTSFFLSSILTPIHSSSLTTPARIVEEFSPMPAEKAMVSKPCIACAISMASCEVR